MHYTTVDGTAILYSEKLKTAGFFKYDEREYLNDLKEEYRPTAKYLSDTYPQAKGYIKDRIKELSRELKLVRCPETLYNEKTWAKQNTGGYREHQSTLEFFEVCREGRIERIEEKLKHYRSIMFFLEGNKVGGPELDIEKAKAFPITNLINFNRMNFAPCPFHNEKLPSMKYYPKTNSVYCFGCQWSGDSIAVAQKLLGLDFKEAVKYLTNG